MGERHGRVLAELAETGMVMVRRLSAAMLATDDVQTQAQLGLAYHRVSRAVRQTIALEFRLSQDARRDVAPVRPTPPAEPKPAAPPRVRAERTGWAEYERDDSNEAFDDLDADPVLIHALRAAPAHAGRPSPKPNATARRSQLLGGAAITPPRLAALRPPTPAWRSSA
ncbi:MAG: hypothetical protein KKE02_21160 [Alphaproteobacteria bacterium]|nr:hypothetical protein [Alphaproteobacteria bacterium]MBU2096914.1 hypothetical protein [Alphaproteobacteria bacterium]MBU2153541.1 hypothetical protein [Alphaproteobacteria bacterium]MBU2361896.1 hypothetical protein [Alphaproteobacteria bacterium]